MTGPPPDIAGLLERLGAGWTRDERERFVEWLLTDRLSWLLAVASRSLRFHGQGTPLREDVEDVVSEFLGVTINAVMGTYDPDLASIFALIRTALGRLAKDVGKKARRRVPITQSPVHRNTDGRWIALDVADARATSRPDVAAIDEERRAALLECIDRLSGRSRTVVLLRLDGESYEEIATHCDVTVGTLKVRHSLALRALRECLSDLRPAPPQTPQPNRVTPVPVEVDLDTLVVGGGVMGLVLLGALNARGLSALALERGTLGGEQTCHSHVYIHQGHLYQDGRLASRLQGTTPFWRDLIDRHNPHQGFLPSLFGFTNEPDAVDRTHQWTALGLPYDDVSKADFPGAIATGAITTVYQSPEVCLTGDSLMRVLQRGVAGERLADQLSRVETIADVGVNATREIEHVDVRLPGGEIRFRPRTLVLAAGAGNQALLDRIAGAGAFLQPAVQQIRQAHMLVIRGPSHALTPLTGVFHLTRRLFLVSRLVDNDVVWLVSDEQSPLQPKEPRGATHDPIEGERSRIAQWLRGGVIASLRELAPTLFATPSSVLSWGVYPAPIAEGQWHRDGVPSEERVVRFLPNAWVVWPTKLTLAPLAATSLVDGIEAYITTPRPWPKSGGSQPVLPQPWTRARAHVAVAKERWALIDRWDNWTGFEGAYGPFP